MSTPLIGYGLAFEFASVLSPTTFTTLEGVQSVTLGSAKVDQIDVTTVDTPNRTKVFLSGLEDPGDVTLTCNYLPGDTSQVALFAIKSAGIAVPMKVVYPNSLGSASFSGLVLSMDISFPLDKECKLTIKAKASGPITIA